MPCLDDTRWKEKIIKCSGPNIIRKAYSRWVNDLFFDFSFANLGDDFGVKHRHPLIVTVEAPFVKKWSSHMIASAWILLT